MNKRVKKYKRKNKNFIEKMIFNIKKRRYKKKQLQNNTNSNIKFVNEIKNTKILCNKSKVSLSSSRIKKQTTNNTTFNCFKIAMVACITLVAVLVFNLDITQNVINGDNFTSDLPRAAEDVTVTDTNSDVTIEMVINDFDGSFEKYDSVGKVVTLTAYFPVQTVANKSISLTVPEGLEYSANGVPVPQDYVKPSTVNSSVVNVLGEGQPLANQAISSVIVPNVHTATDSTFGTVTYTLNETADKIVLTFYVKGDDKRIYGDHDILQDIVATAKYNDIEVKSSVDVSAKYTPTYWVDFERYHAYATSNVVASTNTETIYNYTRNPFELENMIYVLEGKVTTYYPVGMEFQSIVAYNYIYTDNNTMVGKTVTHDDSIGKAEISFENGFFYNGTSVKYKVPEGLANGVYSTTGIPVIEYTTYDGKKFTQILKRADSNLDGIADDGVVFDSVTVSDRNDFGNPISLTQTSNLYPLYETSEGYSGITHLKNSSPFATGNIIYEVKVDPNFEAKRVRIPKATDAVSIMYKTNKNDEFVSYDITKSWTLDAVTLGLDSDEYFTEVIANIGYMKSGYYSYGPSSSASVSNAVVYGKQKSGITEVTHTVSAWVDGDKENTLITVNTNSKLDSHLVNIVPDGTSEMYKDGNLVTAVTAGDTVHAVGYADIFAYMYGNSLIIENPYFIFREDKGITIHPSTIRVIDPVTNEELNYNIDKITSPDGSQDTYYKVTLLEDRIIGAYTDYPIKEQKLKVAFDFTTDTTATDSYVLNINDIFAFGQTGSTGTNRNGGYMLEDGIDLNGNGTTTDRMLTSKTYPLTINKNNHVVVDTYLSLDETTRYPTYMPSYPETAVNYTPGLLAHYNISVRNSSPYSASDFVLYFPIPKEGENFGPEYQAETFMYNMKLESLIADSPNLEITYGTGVTQSTITTASYVANPVDISQVNMIKIVAKGDISMGQTIDIEVPIIIDETFETTTSKVNEMNIFNPYFSVDYVVYSGWKKGTPVGAKLVLMNIEGIMFVDEDFDGTYNSSADSVLNDIEVGLYRKQSDGTYLPVVKDGINVTVKTDANGRYNFTHEDISEISQYMVKPVMDAYPNYVVTAYETGSDYTIDSDIIVGEDSVKNIDPTLDPASYINMGYIEKQEISLEMPKIILLDPLASAQYQLVDSESSSAGIISPHYFESLGGEYEILANSNMLTYSTFVSGDKYIRFTAKDVATTDFLETDLIININDRYSNTATGKTKVLIFGMERMTDSGLSAVDATITNEEAQNITVESLIKHTDAVAYSTITGEKLEIRSSDLTDIRNVTYLGGKYNVDLITDEGKVTVEITVEDTYKKDASLNDIKVNGTTIAGFNSSILEYSMTVPHTVTSADILAMATDVDATIEAADLGVKNLSVGKNVLDIEVTAHDVNVKQTYRLNITREGSPDNSLTSLTVLGNIAVYNSTTGKYEVKVLSSDSNIFSSDIVAVVAEGATFNLGSGMNLEYGDNDYSISVTSQSGLKAVYDIVITRKYKIDASLSDIKVNGTTVVRFTPNTYTYDVILPYATSNANISAITSDTDASIKADDLGNKVLNVGSNRYSIEVTAQDGITKATYILNIIRQENSDNSLLSLTILGNTAVYNSATSKYEVNVLSSVSNISSSDVVGIVAEGATFDSGTGINLVAGDNNYSVSVTSQSGVVAVYDVVVTRAYKTDASLSSIKIDDVLVNNFETGTYTYNVSVPMTRTNVNLSAVTSDIDADIKAGDLGNKVLNEGLNTFNIEVTAEDGITKLTYVLNITREEYVVDTNNKLSSLSVEGYSISPVFNEDTTEYSVSVPYNVDNINVIALAASLKSTVNIVGNDALVIGNNNVTITVTAENGVSQDYVIIVTKEEKVLDSNVNLKELNVSGYNTNPRFNKDTINYEMNVKNSVTSLSINAIAESDTSVVTIVGNENFKVGINEIVIKVTAENGNIKEYVINVNRLQQVIENENTDNNNEDDEVVIAKSNDNYLKSLTIEDHEITFDKDVTEYDVNVNASINELDLSYILSNEKAVATVIGNKNFESGNNNVIEIKVTAEDGSIRTYTINVNKSSITINADLKELKVDGINVLSGNQTNYTVEVPLGSQQIVIEAIAENPKAVVKGTGTFVVKENSTYKITVTDENGFDKVYELEIKTKTESETELLESNSTMIGLIAILVIIVVIIIVVIINKLKRN